MNGESKEQPAASTSIEHELDLLKQAVIHLALEQVKFVAQFGNDTEQNDSFTVEIPFVFDAHDVFYYEKNFTKKVAESMENDIAKTMDCCIFCRWSEDTDKKELPKGRSNQAKAEREAIEKWNKAHKIRVLKVFCKKTAFILSERNYILSSIVEFIIMFFKHAVTHPENDTCYSDELFVYSKALSYFSFIVDPLMSASFKGRRNSALPLYCIDPLKKALEKIPHVTKAVISEKIVKVHTDIYMPNRYKKIKLDK